MTQARDPLPTCVYCGVPIKAGRTCSGHRDLEQVDPLGSPARKPASEHELGVRNQHRVPRRAGRDELYRRLRPPRRHGMIVTPSSS